MRVLGLFSGIGGFELGLQRAGMTITAMCEIDPFCRRVLAKHWPGVPIYDDVRNLTGQEVGSIDIVCGGFPCQPFSSAARGRCDGVESDGFLWPEMRRLVEECQPSWVIGENVTHIDRLALERVVSDLETLDYEVAAPLEIPACAVGHDHRRSRYWFLGYANRDRKSGLRVHAEVAGLPRAADDSRGVGAPDGVSERLDRHRMSALGNAVVPQIPEMIGRAILAQCDRSPTGRDRASGLDAKRESAVTRSGMRPTLTPVSPPGFDPIAQGAA